MKVPYRLGVAMLGSLALLAVFTFVAVRLGTRYDLWTSTGLIAYFGVLAGSIVWALAPAYASPHGLKVPPLALAVLLVLLPATAVSFYLMFVLWGTFGGEL